MIQVDIIIIVTIFSLITGFFIGFGIVWGTHSKYVNFVFPSEYIMHGQLITIRMTKLNTLSILKHMIIKVWLYMDHFCYIDWLLNTEYKKQFKGWSRDMTVPKNTQTIFIGIMYHTHYIYIYIHPYIHVCLLFSIIL